LLWLA